MHSLKILVENKYDCKITKVERYAFVLVPTSCQMTTFRRFGRLRSTLLVAQSTYTHTRNQLSAITRAIAGGHENIACLKTKYTKSSNFLYFLIKPNRAFR